MANEERRPEGQPPKGGLPALAMMKRDVVDVVADRVRDLTGSGELHLPANYSADNAVKAAWLALQSVEDRNGKKALEVCTRDSIANALLDMVIQGLTPARRQCYFIVYGRTLTCQRSYFGDVSIVKRIYAGADVVAEPVYKDDEFEYELDRGRKRVIGHKQKLANVSNDLGSIVAGYAQVFDREGRLLCGVVMTIDQIRDAWKASKTWKPGKPGTFHEDTPHHAVRRTVLRRAATELINTADDSYLVIAARRQSQLSAEVELAAEMDEEANGELLALEGDAPEGDGEIIDLSTEEGQFEAAMDAQGGAEPPAEPEPQGKGGKPAQARLGDDPGF